MKKLSPLIQIPTGVRDLLPGEAWKKRSIEAALIKLFQQWGYQEVATPTFEFYEVVREEDASADQLFKFIDREGRILALRPDMTTPIARMAATHLRTAALPLRLCYTGSVFRYESIQTGRHREFSQAGVELIGAKGVEADAEVVALAVESLLKSDLQQFRLGIGQVMITKGLLEQITEEPLVIKDIKTAIINKDLVGLEQILEQQGCSPQQKAKLLSILSLHGSREVLEQARQLSDSVDIHQAIDALEHVYSLLEGYGLAQYIFFDLSILRDFEYYTGIVFEGYAAGLGYPVCGGGRYDKLLDGFGFKTPAVGFALGLERVLLAKNDNSPAPGADYLLLGSQAIALLKKAKELRDQGCNVVIDLAGLSRPEADRYAKEKGIAQVLVVHGGNSDA